MCKQSTIYEILLYENSCGTTCSKSRVENYVKTLPICRSYVRVHNFLLFVATGESLSFEINYWCSIEADKVPRVAAHLFACYVRKFV